MLDLTTDGVGPCDKGCRFVRRCCFVTEYMEVDSGSGTMGEELDNIDRGIIHLLQLDARNTTAKEIANKTGVSASTVRNRIEQLEERGIITGYHPSIDYEAANLPLQVLFIISAPATKRSDYVEKLLDIKGVVDIRETLTARRNILVEVVATNTSDIARITESIHEMELEIESSEMLKQKRVQPFNQFHYEGELGDQVKDEENVDRD